MIGKIGDEVNNQFLSQLVAEGNAKKWWRGNNCSSQPQKLFAQDARGQTD
jgi:hypothetical protein